MSSLKEVLGSFRRGPTVLRACPQCGSTVVRSRMPLEGSMLPVTYVCRDCGYHGVVAFEEEREAEPEERGGFRTVDGMLQVLMRIASVGPASAGQTRLGRP